MGIIAKTAVDKFLNRQLNNYSWIKNSTRQDLEAYLAELPYQFNFKTKPFKHQLACIILGLELDSFLFLADMGVGKSLCNKTLILTPEGYKKMGDIKLGEFVVSSKGTPTLITGVFPQGKKDIYEITFSDGAKARCCKDHLWSVWNQRSDPSEGIFRVLSLNQIIKKGILDNKKHPYFYLPAVEFSSYKGTKIPRIKKSRAMQRVDKIGHGECTCISVVAKNGLFVIEDFILTHNSKMSIDCINARVQKNQIKKSLILVPSPINMAGWESEISIHSDLRATSLEGSRDEKLRLLEEDSSVFLLNYMGLQTLVTKNVPTTKKGKKKNERQIVNRELNALCKNFECIVLDELHLCKNPKSLTYRIVNQLCKQSLYRYGLTGTPFGRDPTDFWAEFFLIDRGLTLGTTLGLYRAAYFTQKNNWWGGIDYKFNKDSSRHLARTLKNRSIRYADWETNDLPTKSLIPVVVKFENSAQKEYKEVLKRILDLKDSEVKEEGNFTKLRQIASGFIKLVDDEGDVNIVDFPDNPKIEALKDLLLQLPANRKMVIFYEFIKSGDMIEKLLRELKIGHVRLDGTVKGKDKGKKALHKFNNDAKCRIFSANSKSGGVGLNLQVANYMVFFESPVSPIVRKQAEKRIHRTGQTRKTFIYSLIVKNSIDEHIEELLREGRDLFELLIDGGSSTTKKLIQSLFERSK